MTYSIKSYHIYYKKHLIVIWKN